MGLIYTSRRIATGKGFADPRDFATPVGWWRADIGTSGGASWADVRGGTFPTLTQGTAAKQAALTADAGKGRPGLAFDGTNDLISATFTLVQPFQVHIVFKTTAGGASAHDAIFDGGANLTACLFVDSAPESYIYAGSNVIFAGTAINNGVIGVATAQFNGASSALRNNGLQVVSGNANTGNPGGLTLGALAGESRWSATTVLEVIVYSAIQSAEATVEIERSLKNWHSTP